VRLDGSLLHWKKISTQRGVGLDPVAARPSGKSTQKQSRFAGIVGVLSGSYPTSGDNQTSGNSNCSPQNLSSCIVPNEPRKL
jgi:hypothetical protein